MDAMPQTVTALLHASLCSIKGVKCEARSVDNDGYAIEAWRDNARLGICITAGISESAAYRAADALKAAGVIDVKVTTTSQTLNGMAIRGPLVQQVKGHCW